MDETQVYYETQAGFSSGFLIGLALLVVCAIGVYVDAKSIGARRGLTSGMAGTSAGMWAFGTVAMWILVFPLYLLTRGKIKAAARAADRREAQRYGQPKPTRQEAAWDGLRGWGASATTAPWPSVTPPAGWFLDPENPEFNRWWDGNQWTDHRVQRSA